MLKFLYLCGKKDNEVLWYAMQLLKNVINTKNKSHL